MRIFMIAGFLALVITIGVLILAGCSAKEEGDVSDGSGGSDTLIVPEIPEYVKPSAILVIRVGDAVMYAPFEDNPSAKAFRDMLSGEGITVDMSDYGGFEKVGALPFDVPANDGEITAHPGDVILYQGNRITLYYGENTWEFTRLAHIGNKNAEELKDILGDGDVTVNFQIEWGE